MSQFPQMIYKAGGTEEIHGGRFSTHIVHDADELAAALADGWSLTTDEARDAGHLQEHVDMVKASGFVPGTDEAGQADDNAAPTRAELEQKAAELGVEFSPRLGDAKLAERIEAALAKA